MKIRFYPILLVLFCFTNAYSLPATHKVQVGFSKGVRDAVKTHGEKYQLLGGYFELESQWNNHWVSMVNTIGGSYSFGQKSSEQMLYYTMGARVFLGTPIVFVDLFTGFTKTFSQYNPLPTIGLGFGVNVPMSNWINFQISFDVKYLFPGLNNSLNLPLFDMIGKVGLQFII